MITFLDGYKSVKKLLEVGVTMYKINRSELEKIVLDLDIKSLSESLSEPTTALTIPEMGSLFFKAFPKVKLLGVTDGGQNAFLMKDKGMTCYEYILPKLSEVVNPIGAGDTVGAVFMCSVL